ncbi:hypothetical protein MIR68_007168 [Amoeboaphelidium protococcarum]|nr:hypothetical protein MIR68_007168 [Amoeboaphelidium protococcarum]
MRRRQKSGQQNSQHILTNAPAESVSEYRPQMIRSSGWLKMFIVLSCVRCAMSIIMPILSDCDEVFNYWEPSHYLNYGHAFQTWEYAPQYAIRSWFYVAIHSAVIHVFKLLMLSKVSQFYALRCVLCIMSSFSETMLYQSVRSNISPQIAKYMIAISVFSPGMYIASSAYLPSSFAMYTTALAFAQLFKSYGLQSMALTNSISLTNPFKAIGIPILIIACGAIIGWPFSGLVAVPFVFEELFVRSLQSGNTIVVFARRLLMVVYSSVVSLLVILVPLILFDAAFYRKIVVVPLNIVLYNVFNSSQSTDGDGGPNIYGTEPWYFYLKNGFLNFNLAFIAALMSVGVLCITSMVAFKTLVSTINVSFLASSNGRPFISLLFKLLPMYLWMLVFSAQPHKEERFLFVIYPLISLSAAICLCLCKQLLIHVLQNHKRSASQSSVDRIMLRLPKLAMFILMTTYACLSMSRIYALHKHYGSAIEIYSVLRTYPSVISSNDIKQQTLCLDSEWYRFPSHYLLPENMKVIWLDSDFDGQLPAYFESPNLQLDSQNALLSWLINRPGTFRAKASFNDRNQKVLDRFGKKSQCDFYIRYNSHDNSIQDDKASKQKSSLTMKTYVTLADGSSLRYQSKVCLPFLDAEATESVWARSFYLPKLATSNSMQQRRFQKRYGEYCLYSIH